MLRSWDEAIFITAACIYNVLEVEHDFELEVEIEIFMNFNFMNFILTINLE